MTFYPVDILLLSALVMTTACVVLVYRKLRELEANQWHYERALSESTAALVAAHRAVANLNMDGRELLVSLEDKIEQAQEAIAEIDRRNNAMRARTRGGREDSRPLDLGRDGDLLPHGA